MQELVNLTLTATNGSAALTLLGTAHPSLILLDLMMPVMDGWTFCRLIKADSQTSSLPVIVMSADLHLPDKARDIGVDSFLRKPFDIEALLALVARYAN